MIFNLHVLKNIILSFLCIGLLSLSTFVSAKGKSSNDNFLHGKPFASLNGKISNNTEAVDAVTDSIEALSNDLAKLEAQVSENTSSISDTAEQVTSLSDSYNNLQLNVTDIATDLFNLQVQHQKDIDNFLVQLSTIQSQIGGLTEGLNELTAQLAREVESLNAAISNNNSVDIQALTTSVSLLSAQVSLAQTDILNLQNRVAQLEQQFATQQNQLDSLAADLAALQAIISLPVAQNDLQEYVFVDTGADDLDGSELVAFLQDKNVTAESFIYVEGNISGSAGAWCSTNAEFYVSNYLKQSYEPVLSGVWNKWAKRNGSGWAQNNSSYNNYYGGNCAGNNSWCSEWGIGGNTIAFAPSWTTGEVYNGGNSNGNGTFILRLANTRFDACGF